MDIVAGVSVSRRAKRQRVLFSARLRGGEGNGKGCMVRNISDVWSASALQARAATSQIS